MKRHIINAIMIILSTMPYSVALGKSDYYWPIHPKNLQHRINGTFGEVRGDSCRDHMHAGVDMDRTDNAPNTPVYSVTNGYVLEVSGDRVTIKYNNQGTIEYYTYIHLKNIPVYAPLTVYANQTILGYINTGNSTHLHFCDGYYKETSATLYNPLWYIWPFADDTNPIIDFEIVVLNEDTTDFEAWPWGLYIAIVGDTLDVYVKAHDEITTYGGTNNGVDEIKIVIEDDEYQEVASFHNIDFFYVDGRANWDVNLVYANGSRSHLGTQSSGIYIYKATNSFYQDGYWIPNKEGFYSIIAHIWDGGAGYNEQTFSLEVKMSPHNELEEIYLPIKPH